MISRFFVSVLIWMTLCMGGANVLASSTSDAELVIDLIPHPGGTAMMTLSRADQACDGARRLARKIPSGVREAGGVALSVYVAVPTSEGMAWMEIDCGNGGANVIGKHLAPLFKLDPGKRNRSQPVS
jgi:hypothetical protein